MFKSRRLIQQIGNRFELLQQKRGINYKLSVNHNYPAFNKNLHREFAKTKNKAYDNLLETLKIIYLREAQTKFNKNVVNISKLEAQISPNDEVAKKEFKIEHIATQSSLNQLETETEEFFRSENMVKVDRTKEGDSLVEGESTESMGKADELINKAKIQVERLRSSFDLLIENQRLKRKELSYEEVEFSTKHQNFNKDIKAYIDVCCNSSSLTEEAFKVIEALSENEIEVKNENQLENTAQTLAPTLPPTETETNKTDVKNGSKLKKRRIKGGEVAGTSATRLAYEYISDVEIYNRLMFQLAKTGKISKHYLIFKKMRASKSVTPNLNSYAAVLQTFGYQLEHKIDIESENTTGSGAKIGGDSSDAKKQINTIRLSVERILWDIQKAKLSLDDLSTSMNFSSEQQYYIKKALNLIIPTFEFKAPKDLSKLNPLLQSLWCSQQTDLAKTDDVTFYPTELTDKKLLMENFSKQLDDERSINIEVPSIRSLTSREKNMKEIRENERNTLLKSLREQITRSFVKKLALLKNSHKKEDNFLFPFLNVMDKQVYIEIVLQEAIKLAQNSQYFSASATFYAYNFGSIIETKYHEYLLTKNNDIKKLMETYEKYVDFTMKRLANEENSLSTSHREEWLRIMRELDSFKTTFDCPWSSKIKMYIGKFLLNDILLKSVKVTKTYKVKEGLAGVYKDPQIKVDSDVAKKLSSTLMFETNRMPMLVPPMPWYASTHGGYFLSKSNLLRLHEFEKEQHRIAIDDAQSNSQSSTMNTVYDSLNTLGACSWRVNEPILDLLIDVFNEGGNKELEMPEPSTKGPDIPTIPRKKLEKAEYRELYKAIEKAKKIRAEMHSLWQTELYRLSIANMYRNKIFWLPHSLDFRGRAYPIPPHFNHLGSDIARSIILFGEGKKLGPKGLDMLLLHLVNLTGSMKRSTLSERLTYARSIMSEILDSADKPLSGRKWWQKSEEKWQTLACCMEIANAHRSSDPAEYVSYYPVHQDGSCNGLQHYAALGRDKEGAISVNLHPSERPQDVYTSVLELVEKQRIADEMDNNEMAKSLAGFIKRKTIKQTVMTTVYNVTFYGAKLQIQRQLEDTKGFPVEQVKEASSYIATKTFNSIRKLFNSAQEIQDWFSECAFLITRIRNSSVKWETPLGLPVSQPYFKSIALTNENTTKFSKKLLISTPDSMKQRNAFPPNYIHSLDSCHMMLTSLFCERAKVTFVSVHDCFWTHPTSVDLMNKICREQFVALHSLPLLENLSEYFMKNYKFSQTEIDEQRHDELRNLMILFNKKLESVPKKGEFDLNLVLKSTYFFS